MEALIYKNRVVELSENRFDVAGELRWMPCPDECKAGSWELVDGNLQPIPEPEDTRTYSEKRKEEYDKLNQFEMQFNDQRDGTTTWVDAINDIKARYPK